MSKTYDVSIRDGEELILGLYADGTVLVKDDSTVLETARSTVQEAIAFIDSRLRCLTECVGLPGNPVEVNIREEVHYVSSAIVGRDTT
jgi:hypothetical protein